MNKVLFLVLSMALYTGTALGQEAQIEYEIAGALRLGTEVTANGVRVAAGDFNDDGVVDLVTFRMDAQDNPLALVVFDPVAQAPLLSIPYADIVAALDGQEPTRFLGFFHFYEDDTLAAIFQGEGVLGIIAILIEKRAAPPLTLPAEQALVLDLDQDGLVEVVIRNPETHSIQVWGTDDTGTASERGVVAALHRLLPNYPNPFREATTITYEVARPGRVLLEVFDVQGRCVRVLVARELPAGMHRITWDGTDDAGMPVAAGTYLYRLRVGEQVSSGQALRLR